jgi:hypothetical protein
VNIPYENRSKNSPLIIIWNAHHQGLGNRLIIPDSAHMGNTGEVRRRERLGGMLNYYYRDAA